MDPLRANSEFLRGQWSRRTGLKPRPAAGGSGPVDVVATVGSTFVGSTTIPDPVATFGTDDAGLRYQVLYTEVVGVSGTARIEVVGVDTGPNTNLEPGATLKPANGPIGWTVPGIVATKFRGGRLDETDAELARRIAWWLRHKQAAGNNADFRGWAEGATASVEAAFEYAAAAHAGSIFLALTQARGNVRGPLGRIPSVGTITAVRAAVTPPGSSQVPSHPYVLVTPTNGVACDTVARLSMPRASDTGWADLDVWPGTNDDGDPVTVTLVTNQQDFRITIGVGSDDLPSGLTPRLMVWDATISRYEALVVQAVLGAVTSLTLLSYAALRSQIAAGKLKALAVTGARRLPELPDVPTVAESGYPGFQSLSWSGISVAKGTPQPVVDRLEAAAVQAMQSESLRNRLTSVGFVVPTPGSKAYSAFIKSEIDTWTRVIKTAGIQPE